jgi:uncharacterized protein YbcV (DUF1398 family)
MNREEIAQSEVMSMKNVPFPQVVAKLAAAGVETYSADLVRLEKTFYAASGETCAHRVPLADPGMVAPAFSAPEVRVAVGEIQQGRVSYSDFLRRIIAAGTMGYLVFITGRRVLYFGRDGQSHLEVFPP